MPSRLALAVYIDVARLFRDFGWGDGGERRRRRPSRNESSRRGAPKPLASKLRRHGGGAGEGRHVIAAYDGGVSYGSRGSGHRRQIDEVEFSRGRNRRQGHRFRSNGSKNPRSRRRTDKKVYSLEELDAQMDHYFSKHAAEEGAIDESGSSKKARLGQKGEAPDVGILDSAMDSYWDGDKKSPKKDEQGNPDSNDQHSANAET